MHRAASIAIGISSVFIASPQTVKAQQAFQVEQGDKTTHILPRWPDSGEQLVLSTTEGQSRLFIRKVDPIASIPNLALLEDLRDRVTAVPFGEGQRCEASDSHSDIIVTCMAGSDPAGILLRFDGSVPPGAGVEAAVATETSDGFRLQLVNAGDDATAAMPASGRQRLPLPGKRSEPIQMVFLAPAEGGSLRLTDLRLVPTQSVRAIDGGAWIWEPDAWRKRGNQLIHSAAQRGLKHLYITLVIENGEVQHSEDLRRFIRTAAGAQIAVEAVEGDPRMVLADGLSMALDRARAIARYQENAPATERLSAVQYDIEPYVLPGWGTPPVDHDAWSHAVNALAKAVGEPVHLVLPFWVAGEPAGVRFLRDIEASTNAVTIMSYRSDGALAALLAEPLLHWGQNAGKPIRIALEAGPVATEVEETFIVAESGQLALIETEGQVTATVLREATVVPGATMYASRGTTRTQSDRISFLGNEQEMLAAAEQVARVASAWDSFAGIGFHGLSWPEP